MLLILALACDPAELKLGDSNSISADDSGVNTDDSDVTTDDSGGDTDDTEEPEPTDEGDYSGELSLVLENDWQPATCDGELSFSIDADGALVGTASCFMADWQQEWAGDLIGTDEDGSLEVVWAIPWGWGGEVLEVPGTGTVSDGMAYLVFEYDMGRMGKMTGDASAERQ
jgi:hypothetical protein